MMALSPPLVQRPGESAASYRLRRVILEVFRFFFEALFILTFRPIRVLGGIPAGRVRRILVYAPNKGVGDVVLYLPALRALRVAFPAAHISLAAGNFALELLTGEAVVDDVIPLPAGPSWKEKARYVRFLRARRFDLGIDLIRAYSFESSFLVFLSGARYCAGIDYGKHGLPLNVRHRVPESLLFGDMMMSLIERVAGRKFQVSHRPPAGDFGVISSLESRFPNEIFVAVHPGARDNLDLCDKRWPAASYGALINALCDRWPVRILLVGSTGERDTADAVLRLVKDRERVVDLVGRTNLKELIGALQRVRLFIGNNSGPLHIANESDVPNISFSGGVDLRCWRPRNEQRLSTVVLRDANCREEFCWRCPDKGIACLGQVSVDRVADIAGRVIQFATMTRQGVRS